MASKAKKKDRKQRSKKRVVKKKDYTLWYVGAGILALIAIPVGINAYQFATAPGEFYRSQGNAHVSLEEDVPEYNSVPATSGWHTGNITSWGSYDYLVPERTLIHNMEDAGVILYYPFGSPEENAEHIERLEQAVAAAEEAKGERYRRIVIAPHENLASQYVLTAWTRKLELDDLDQNAITQFIDRYEGIDHHAAGG